MSLREEVALYSELSGNDGSRTPIMIIGAYLDGYEKGKAEAQIIRCRDCSKREICRTSTVWAVAPSDDWFCGDAERKE